MSKKLNWQKENRKQRELRQSLQNEGKSKESEITKDEVDFGEAVRVCLPEIELAPSKQVFAEAIQEGDLVCATTPANARDPLAVPPPACSRNLLISDPAAMFGLTAGQIVDHMPLRTFELVFPDNKEEQGPNQGMPSFRKLAKEACLRRGLFQKGDWKAVLGECDIHHKRPRCMGASNAHENLVFIDKDVHQEIHRRISRILTKGDLIAERHGGKIKRILDWVKSGRTLERLRKELSAVEGFSFDSSGKLFITIPCPEEAILIPRFSSKYAFETRSHGEQDVPAPRYPVPAFALAPNSAPQAAA